MNKVARAGSAISARAQVFPISGVLLANLAWGIGPILTVAIDMSVNSTIFYRVTMWPLVLYFIARNRKAEISLRILRSALVPGIFFGVSTIFGFMSFTNTSIANATLIGSTSSAMMLFIAPIHGILWPLAQVLTFMSGLNHQSCQQLGIYKLTLLQVLQ